MSEVLAWADSTATFTWSTKVLLSTLAPACLIGLLIGSSYDWVGDFEFAFGLEFSRDEY